MKTRRDKRPGRSFPIKGRLWQLSLVRLPELRRMFRDAKIQHRSQGGLCDTEQTELAIGRHQGPSQRRETTLHETIHALAPNWPHEKVYEWARTLRRSLDALDDAQRDLRRR